MPRRYRLDRPQYSSSRWTLRRVTRTGPVRLPRRASTAPLAFAHRGGAYHPEIEGLENTLAAFRHAVDARLPLPRDRRPRDQRRRAAGLPRHASWTGSPTAPASIARARRTPRCGSALVGGRERVPTLAELFDAFPDARFNIDLKSEGAVAVARRLHRGARGLGPGAGRLVLRPPDQRASAGCTGGRVATSAHPLEVVAFRLLPSGRLAGWLTRGRPVALQIPHRRGRVLVVAAPGSYAGRTPPASTCTCGPSTTRRDARAPRPWCRRPDDRPHRHTQGRARRSAGSGGSSR